MDSHKSSTETGFFSLHQRLVFPCVWATIIHGTWCTSPTPCKTTSSGGDEERMPQEKHGKVVTQWPTSKASLGWKNGKLQLESWMSTGVSTKDRWRPQVKWFSCRLLEEHVCKAKGDIYIHWCWWIVNKKRNATTHWTGSWQARPTKWNGGSKMGKQPHVRVEGQRSTTLMQNAPTYGGMALYLQSSQAENNRAWGHAL